MRETKPSSNGDGKAAGWFRLANDLIDSKAWASLGPAAAKVLVVLARHADKDGVCFPGRKRIAEEAGIAVGSVTRTVLELQAAGLVTRELRTTTCGDSDTNVYRLTLPTPQSGLITSAKTSSQQCEGGVISSVRGVLSGVRTKEDTLKEDQLKEREIPADAGSLPDALLELIDGWNSLGRSITQHAARRDPPAAAVLKGWKRAQKKPEQREAFQDIPRLLTAIRQAQFCHGQDWFSLAWLFGTNKVGEFNAIKLLAGGYNTPFTNGRKIDNSGTVHSENDPVTFNA